MPQSLIRLVLFGRARGPRLQRPRAGRISGAPHGRLFRRWERLLLWIGGGAFVVAAGVISFRFDYMKSQDSFATRTENIRQALAQYLDEGQVIISSLAALYESAGDMKPTEMSAVTGKLLKNYPYIRSVAYLPWVEHGERRAFEREVRTDGNPGYRIRDIGPDGKPDEPSARRRVYLPISFLSARTPRRRLLMGADILSDPVLAEAARRAITDAGLTAAPLDALAPGEARLVLFSATYEGRHDHKPGSTGRQVGGTFMMSLDVGAMLRDLRRDNPRILIDLVPADPQMRETWRRIGFTVAAPEDSAFRRLAPPHMMGWNHALGDLAFGIRVRALTGARDLHGGASFLSVALALLLVLAFAFWLRHRRHDAEHHLALRDRESRLSGVLETVADGIITIDEEGIIETFNPAAEKLFGYGSAEVIGHNVSILMPESFAGSHDSYMAPHRLSAAAPITMPSRELCGRRKDGSQFPIELSLSKADLGPRRMFTGVVRDISDRKRFEAALKASEERFRDFADSASDWFWETDSSLNYAFLSEEYFQRFGVAREQVIGQRFGSFGQNQRDPEFQAGMAAIEALQPFRDFHFSVTLPNGVSAEISFSGKPAFAPGGEFIGFRGTATDMTDRRRLEEQLIQSRRLEAIGKLTGGVAHEFNNLLSVIGGFARMAKRYPGDLDRQGDAIDTIIQAAEQGAQLTRQMLAFSRKQELAPRLVSISEIIEGVRHLLPPLMGENVKLTIDCDLPARVRIDPAQFSQAILNLASNSADAMPMGGALTISATREEFAEPRTFGQQTAEPGRYVALTVADNGCGIPLEDQDQIFEPFYTTKDEDKGSGLGLSMVFGLMAQSGGYVAVNSAPDAGCAFTLYLPEMAEAPDMVRSADGSVQRLAMVVENHEGTREVTAMTLEDEGFTVIKAATAAEALESFRVNPAQIQLLVCSAQMADTNGIALYRELREQIPVLRVVYLVQQESELSELDAGEDSGPREFIRSLQKPIDPDLLVDLVGEIL